jgi:hypothetical protein
LGVGSGDVAMSQRLANVMTGKLKAYRLWLKPKVKLISDG